MARKPKPSGRPPKKGHRKGRSREALKRVPGQREPRVQLLIVCEGAQTEPNYFIALRRKLRLSSVEVKVQSDKNTSDPKRVVDFALKQRAKQLKEARRSQVLGEYDEVWCVMDVENPADNPLFHEAIQQAKREKLQLAVSNPAFEYWFLLHFEDTSSGFKDGQQLKKRLKQHQSSYHESKPMFDELYPHTQLAIQRAKRILRSHADARNPYPNPSTNVFKLVERLRSLAVRKS